MSKEYVKLEEVIKILESHDLSSGAIAEIKMLPIVDVDEMLYSAQATRREDKTNKYYDLQSARWIKENDFYYDPETSCFYAAYSCPYCGAWVNDRSGLPEYCPGCGKKMKSTRPKPLKEDTRKKS